MKTKKTAQVLMAGMLLFQAVPAHAFLGGALQKLGDVTADVISLGEHGRNRDRERANADARYFQLQAQMQRMQLDQQINYLKQQITVVFGYFCDDLSKLKKVHSIQTETFRTISAFKGALAFAKKVENNTVSFQKISQGLASRLQTIEDQINQSFDPSSNRSLLDINGAIGELAELARMHNQDTNMLLAFVMKNVADNNDSLVSNLNMMNLLLSNIHQLLKSLELDILNQMERSTSLNQSALTQLTILDKNVTPILDLNQERITCGFRFKNTNEGFRYAPPHSLEATADYVRSGAFTFAQDTQNLAIDFANSRSRATLIADTMEKAIVLPAVKSDDWSRITSLSVHKMKEQWIQTTLEDAKRFGVNIDQQTIQRIFESANRNLVLTQSDFRGVVSVLARLLATTRNSFTFDAEVIEFLEIALRYAGANGVKKEVLLSAILQDKNMQSADNTSALYVFSKAQVRLMSALMSEARIASQVFEVMKPAGWKHPHQQQGSSPIMPPGPIPAPGVWPIPPPPGR